MFKRIKKISRAIKDSLEDDSDPEVFGPTTTAKQPDARKPEVSGVKKAASSGASNAVKPVPATPQKDDKYRSPTPVPASVGNVPKRDSIEVHHVRALDADASLPSSIPEPLVPHQLSVPNVEAASAPATSRMELPAAIPRPAPVQILRYTRPRDPSTDFQNAAAIDGAMDLGSVDDHVRRAGFDQGVFSDMTLVVLGKQYRLHRLMLLRSPYFRDMLLGPRGDGNGAITTNLVELAVDDSHITAQGVDLALAALYGNVVSYGFSAEDERDQWKITRASVLSLLSAAQFFQVEHLAKQCLDFIRKFDLAPHHHRATFVKRFSPNVDIQFDATTPPEVLLRYINFVDRFFEFSPKISTVLEDACLSYLCHEGYRSLEDAFCHLPLTWIERVLEADAFWCPNEFARYQFAKRVILRRRLNELKSGDDEGSKRKSMMGGIGNGSGDPRTAEEVYNDIFRYAIIYTHMSFEQLGEVRADGLVTEQILLQSLWQHTRLRSMVEGAAEKTVAFDLEPSAASGTAASGRDPASGGNNWSSSLKFRTMRRRRASSAEEVAALPTKAPKESMADEKHGNGGTNRDSVTARMLGLSAGGDQVPIAPVRIGVQFKHLDKLMKPEGGRTYSDTFFYGGSWWTVFLQRFPPQSPDDKEKWGAFLRRSESKQLTKLATSVGGMSDEDDESGAMVVKDPFSGSTVDRSVSYYHDRRQQVRASFKLFNAADRSYEPVFESKPNDYAETQSWGYRSRDHVVSELDVQALRTQGGSTGLTVRLSVVLQFL